MANLKRRNPNAPGDIKGRNKNAPSAVALVLLSLGILHVAAGTAADGSGQATTGADVYLKYCAGCHGFDGIAEYPFAPSFAWGERLHKSDAALLESVLAGRHAMPHWQGKLSVDMFRLAIGYIREMDQRFRAGLPPRSQPLPEVHYRFNPVGHEDYWKTR